MGGKYAYDDDQETPNTLMATYDYGGGREIMFEVRGLLTGGEGIRRPDVAARDAVAAAHAAQAAPPPAPLNVQVGNLFYGTEGWAAMSDGGFQAYKGAEIRQRRAAVMERAGPSADRSIGDPTVLHMKNFLSACRSRNYKELHDEIGNAYLSASLCHLANISYRTGHKLTIEAGPKFANDAEANKLLTREPYRKPYVV